MKNSLTITNNLETLVLTKLDSEERKMIIASQGAKRFRDFDTDDKRNLAKTLVKLSYFVGIKEPIGLDAVKMLVIFLVSEYPNLTTEELEQGVFFCCSGKLGSFEHFQNFSPIYIGKIINAYQNHTNHVKTKFKRLMDEEERRLAEKELESKFDAKQELLNTILREYDIYIQTNKYAPDKIMLFSDIVAQTCVMILNTYNFFDADKKDKDPFVTLKNYFVTLPTHKNEAIEQIKSDVNVCYQRKNK